MKPPNRTAAFGSLATPARDGSTASGGGSPRSA